MDFDNYKFTKNSIGKIIKSNNEDIKGDLLDRITKGKYSLVKDNSISISDCIFWKKFERFILNISDTSLEDRFRFMDKYINDKESEFYEKIMIHMDNIKEMQLCNIYANFFKALLNEKITLEEWEKISMILTNLSFYDIKQMEKIKFDKQKIYLVDDKITSEEKYTTLKIMSNNRICSEPLMGNIRWGGGVDFKLTELGIKFLKYKNYYDI